MEQDLKTVDEITSTLTGVSKRNNYKSNTKKCTETHLLL